MSFARIDLNRLTTLVVFQDVSATQDRMEKFRLKPVVDLAAKVVDINVDDVRAGIEVVMPDMLREDGAREDPVDVSHEILQERELLAGQLDRGFPPFRLVRDRIELEVGDLQEGRLFQGPPADEGAHARHQLRERKRLGEI